MTHAARADVVSMDDPILTELRTIRRILQAVVGIAALVVIFIALMIFAHLAYDAS